MKVKDTPDGAFAAVITDLPAQSGIRDKGMGIGFGITICLISIQCTCIVQIAGGIDRDILTACKRIITIPSNTVPISPHTCRRIPIGVVDAGLAIRTIHKAYDTAAAFDAAADGNRCCCAARQLGCIGIFNRECFFAAAITSLAVAD